MKNLLITLLVIGLLVAGFFWFIGDRDRGMWLMNTAIGSVSSATSVTNLTYGDKQWQKLDVYPQKSTSPVLVFIHGGSWRHGRKDQYFFAADAFSRLGYTVVLPDYIKHPDQNARFPAFIEDGAQALAWVKHNIADYNGDPNNIFVAGHSAGAHTALMLATDAQYLNAVGLTERDLRGVAGIAGPYSFTPDWYVTKEVFGPPDRYPLMDVFNYVDGEEPSTLLLHSKADTQVGQYNQEGLAERLQANGVDVETVLYEQFSHIDILLKLHPWFAGETTVAQDIDHFFKARVETHNNSAANQVSVANSH
ncbi:alpha/beta hydrolase [Arenicella xantha]|uniref:Acetyl esterase/lipase n=1 Tax=Arenicella xantha TaxID=644221 RepID=A0A395JPW2_9GAMM|nr:alpha/beta hydrolase [Arenicella xantha]RBP51608.1 acetyl esterase/lipase [Arenicella xantha]